MYITKFSLFFSQKVLALEGGTQVGKIDKQYAGILKEAFTTADKFGVSCKNLKLI